MEPFIERQVCLFCKKSEFNVLLEKDFSIPIGCYSVNEKEYKSIFIPYNVLYCKLCKTVQTKYEGNVSLIYNESFAGLFGSTRNVMNVEFSKFILENETISSILEIGAGNGDLANLLLENKAYTYTIIDPSYWGHTENRTVIKSFLEDVEIKSLNADTVVMSHVFEHIYDPMSLIHKISALSDVNYIYINHPNLESFIKNATYHVLNPEHIFYVENSFIEQIFLFCGFKKKRVYDYVNFAVFFEFERVNETISVFPENINTLVDTQNYFSKVQANITRINTIIDQSTIPVYIWPSSAHTNFVISMGLHSDKIINVLDNSPHKIGKYLYGYNLYCKSFKEITEQNEDKIIILAGGCFTGEVIDNLKKNQSNKIYIV
jgi:hypothetical protein